MIDTLISTPWNIEAEQGLLGALLIEPGRIDDVADLLIESHFYAPAHQRIYRAILDMHGAGRIPTPVLLKNSFATDADLQSVGGSDYLVDLATAVVVPSNARDYARSIVNLALSRELIAACGEAMAQARAVSFDRPAAQVMDDLESRLFTLSESGQGECGPVAMAEGLRETIDLIDLYQKGQIKGVKTGLHELDDRTNGLHAGHLIILAGRPSMGKSAMAATLAHNIAVEGKSVLFFSMEMLRTELIQRFYARYTSLPTGMQMRPGALSGENYEALERARRDMAGMKLSIDESAGLSVAQIRSRARRHKRKLGLDIIIIDQLTKIPLPDRYQNKVDQIGFITNALKDLAKDLNVPVLLLHQLSREVEKREDKRPQLSDLRDSGNIEQDADAVMFLYRDEYYLERTEPKRNERDSEEKFAEKLLNHRAMMEAASNRAEVIIAKYRQGQVGTVPCGFNQPGQFFYDLKNQS